MTYLHELGAFTRDIQATFSLSWTASGYQATFTHRGGLGAFVVTRETALEAAEAAVAVVKRFTRPDGVIEWSRSKE